MRWVGSVLNDLIGFARENPTAALVLALVVGYHVALGFGWLADRARRRAAAADGPEADYREGDPPAP